MGLGGSVDEVADGGAGGRLVTLDEHRDAGSPGGRDTARVRRLGAAEETEQRRLAGTVGSDDADPVAVVEPEGDAVEQGAGADGQ